MKSNRSSYDMFEVFTGSLHAFYITRAPVPAGNLVVLLAYVQVTRVHVGTVLVCD